MKSCRIASQDEDGFTSERGLKIKTAVHTIRFLKSRKLVMATAESCTAGLIASILAEVEGSGACLDVGIVVYSPSGKAGFLGVEPATIRRFGLTSEEVAREMSEGMLAHEACCADITVANTGIAGPPPPDTNVPAGTQCFAWSYKVNGAPITFSETKLSYGQRNDFDAQPPNTRSRKSPATITWPAPR